MEKQTEHERNSPTENRMDPDSWSWRTLDEPTSQQPTGTLHRSKHQPSKFMIKLEKERQWSSTCCFGRGKKLSDIVIPRLPKVLQNEDFPSAADSRLRDINWQNSRRSNYSLQRPHAVGRGVMFQDVPVSQLADPYVTDLEYVSGNASAEPAEPIRTAASTIEDDPGREIFFMGRYDRETSPVPDSNKNFTLCVQSDADFPALPVGNSSSSGPLRSRRVGSLFPSSDVFEDAEEPTPEPSSDFVHNSQRIESKIQNEMDSLAALLNTSTLVENETDANVACSGDVMEPSAVLSRDGSPPCGLTSGPDDCISLLWKGSCEGTSNSSALLPESLHCPQSGSTEGNMFSDNLSQEDNDGVPAEDGASAPKAQPRVSRKKKLSSGWKLGGACVVEIANTPKGCAEKLREMVNVIAKVEDFEKKNKNGNLVCRFSFQSQEMCDEVISYIDGDKPFEDQSKALECRRLD